MARQLGVDPRNAQPHRLGYQTWPAGRQLAAGRGPRRAQPTHRGQVRLVGAVVGFGHAGHDVPRIRPRRGGPQADVAVPDGRARPRGGNPRQHEHDGANPRRAAPPRHPPQGLPQRRQHQPQPHRRHVEKTFSPNSPYGKYHVTIGHQRRQEPGGPQPPRPAPAQAHHRHGDQPGRRRQRQPGRRGLRRQGQRRPVHRLVRGPQAGAQIACKHHPGHHGARRRIQPSERPHGRGKPLKGNRTQDHSQQRHRQRRRHQRHHIRAHAPRTRRQRGQRPCHRQHHARLLAENRQHRQHRQLKPHPPRRPATYGAPQPQRRPQAQQSLRTRRHPRHRLAQRRMHGIEHHPHQRHRRSHQPPPGRQQQQAHRRMQQQIVPMRHTRLDNRIASAQRPIDHVGQGEQRAVERRVATSRRKGIPQHIRQGRRHHRGILQHVGEIVVNKPIAQDRRIRHQHGQRHQKVRAPTPARAPCLRLRHSLASPIHENRCPCRTRAWPHPDNRRKRESASGGPATIHPA